MHKLINALLMLFLISFCVSCEQKNYYDVDESIKEIGKILAQHDVIIMGESTH